MTGDKLYGEVAHDLEGKDVRVLLETCFRGRPPTIVEEKAEGCLTQSAYCDQETGQEDRAVGVGREALDDWVPGHAFARPGRYAPIKTIRCIEVPWATLTGLHQFSVAV